MSPQLTILNDHWPPQTFSLRVLSQEPRDVSLAAWVPMQDDSAGQSPSAAGQSSSAAEIEIGSKTFLTREETWRLRSRTQQCIAMYISSGLRVAF